MLNLLSQVGNTGSIPVLIAILLSILLASVTGQAPPAETKYRNLQVLKGVPTKDVGRIMRAFNRALGVECAFCHVQGQWENETKPEFATARKMFQMVKVLNENQLANTRGVSCWTCHSGQAKPSRLPHAELDAEEANWPTELASAPEGVKLTMSVYDVTLHVRCNHCHVPADWKSSMKVSYKMVARMKAMFSVFPQYMPPSAGRNAGCVTRDQPNLNAENRSKAGRFARQVLRQI